jgi:hypothetical protein
MKKLKSLKSKSRVAIFLYSISSLPRFHDSTIPMSNQIRSARTAAQLAVIRINEFCKIDNNVPDSNTDNSIIRARKQGYDNALYVIRYLLDQIQESKFEDERAKIAIKMFKYINNNPNVLIYEPNFCNMVMTKINEFNSQITKKTEMFNKADYDKAIKMMKVSMRVNVHNSHTRSAIYKHLDEINSLLNDYNSVSYYEQLQKEMNKVTKTINTISYSTTLY